VDHDNSLDADFADIDAAPIHERRYRVQAYRNDDGTILLRGAVCDQKPGSTFFPDDPDPLTVHHMIVDVVFDPTTFVITDARAVMETHPHEICRVIEPHYGKLVGLSIARGYSAKVRELFGGPRGCSHVTALLLAMAPVAIQSMFSMNMADGDGPPRMTPEERRQRAMTLNLNTCHVWAEDGEMMGHVRDGTHVFFPLWAVRRMNELGLDESAWLDRFSE
jgi:Protein of unknown function (DUF2889)